MESKRLFEERRRSNCHSTCAEIEIRETCRGSRSRGATIDVSLGGYCSDNLSSTAGRYNRLYLVDSRWRHRRTRFSSDLSPGRGDEHQVHRSSGGGNTTARRLPPLFAFNPDRRTRVNPAFANSNSSIHPPLQANSLWSLWDGLTERLAVHLR